MDDMDTKVVYEIEVDNEADVMRDKWDETFYRFFPASSLEEALEKSRKIYGEKVRSIKRSDYIFHMD